jgi:hypothetical protein
MMASRAFSCGRIVRGIGRPAGGYQIGTSPSENEDRGSGRERRGNLQHEYEQSLPWNPRYGCDREEHNHWYLTSHKKLPEVRCGAFVRLAWHARHGNVTEHQA